MTYALDGRALDYLVVQHMEPDHCSLIDEMLRRYPEAKIVCSAKALSMLAQFYGWMRKTARWSLPRDKFPPASIRCISSWRPWSTGPR